VRYKVAPYRVCIGKQHGLSTATVGVELSGKKSMFDVKLSKMVRVTMLYPSEINYIYSAHGLDLG